MSTLRKRCLACQQAPVSSPSSMPITQSPEPSTGLLLGLGVAVSALAQRRQRLGRASVPASRPGRISPGFARRESIGSVGLARSGSRGSGAGTGEQSVIAGCIGSISWEFADCFPSAASGLEGGLGEETHSGGRPFAITRVEPGRVKHRPRLLSDDGPASVPGELREYPLRLRQKGRVRKPSKIGSYRF
jgi:hypothetical protein